MNFEKFVFTEKEKCQREDPQSSQKKKFASSALRENVFLVSNSWMPDSSYLLHDKFHLNVPDIKNLDFRKVKVMEVFYLCVTSPFVAHVF